jgi:hypothetical protein
VVPIPDRLAVQDGQYAIWDGVSDLSPPDPGGESGLVGAAPGLAVVMTGTQFGNISLRVQVSAVEPDLDVDQWDEVAEVSLVTGAGALGVMSGGQGPRQWSALTDGRPGSYRIRVHARGREAGASEDVVAGRPVEDHLVQIWPAPAAPAAVHKVTDEVGAELRADAEDAPWNLSLSPLNEVEAGRPVGAADRVSAELRRLSVGAAGYLLEFLITVDLSGLTPQDERKGRRAVDGYARARLPGSRAAGPLRVVIGYGDGRIADSRNPDDRFEAGQRPGGPIVYQCLVSRYPDGSSHAAEIGFWAWPLPPAEKFTVTIEWPAIGLDPASITVDGAAMLASVPEAR